MVWQFELAPGAQIVTLVNRILANPPGPFSTLTGCTFCGGSGVGGAGLPPLPPPPPQPASNATSAAVATIASGRTERDVIGSLLTQHPPASHPADMLCRRTL